MSPERAQNEKLAADIVVIGGGGAGLVAAVAAAEKGANNIIVLEARRVPGGNAVNAIGLFAVAGQKGVDIKPQRDVIFQKAMNYAHWRINARLVRALVDKSGDIVQWLEEKELKLERANFFGPSHASTVFRCGGAPEGIGYEVVQALVRKCEELDVRLLYQTRAKKLIAEGGKVVGVLAEGKDGEIRITTKSVILAAGGFAGNKKLLKKFLPPTMMMTMSTSGVCTIKETDCSWPRKRAPPPKSW